jgi:osmotically-inducible protein OsmY
MSLRLVPVLALLCALAGCASDESCANHPCTPDEKLVEAVKGNIGKHPALATDDLRVQAHEGIVYLYGLVSTDLELAEVAEAAKSTPGVKSVVNLCSVENSRY